MGCAGREGGWLVFDIGALRLLVTVAGAASFTKAAVSLNCTQSAVSRRIASLEQEAGGPLFERLPRGVRLNPAGRAPCTGTPWMSSTVWPVRSRSWPYCTGDTVGCARRGVPHRHHRVGAGCPAGVSACPAGCRGRRSRRPQRHADVPDRGWCAGPGRGQRLPLRAVLCRRGRHDSAVRGRTARRPAQRAPLGRSRWNRDAGGTPPTSSAAATGVSRSRVLEGGATAPSAGGGRSPNEEA